METLCSHLPIFRAIILSQDLKINQWHMSYFAHDLFHPNYEQYLNNPHTYAKIHLDYALQCFLKIYKNNLLEYHN